MTNLLLPNNIYIYIYISLNLYTYTNSNFLVQIARRILSDFQRNLKLKLIKNITNNVHD